MRVFFLVLLAPLVACSSGSQSDTGSAPAPSAAAPSTGACPTAVGTTVLATEFTSSGERARITLQAGCLYWATADVSGIEVRLRPRSSGTQLPYVGQLMSGGVQGGSTWEIRTTIEGEYDIWVTGAPTGRAVRVTMTVRGSNVPKPN
jgi:hypothetical protein